MSAEASATRVIHRDEMMGNYEQISFFSSCSMCISTKMKPNHINQAKLFLEVNSSIVR